MVPHSNQILDYVHRPNSLDGMPIWDFVAQTEKVNKATSSVETEDNEDEDDDGNCDENETAEVNYETLTTSEILSLTTCAWPVFAFGDGHTEHWRKMLKITHPWLRAVNVLIGPAVPRRDKPDVYERYCRLMLILFKPWRKAQDLRDTGEKWSEAFARFNVTSSLGCKSLMDNMQILHECKDCRDRHMARGSHRRRARAFGLVPQGTVAAEADMLSVDAEGMEQVIDHLSSIAKMQSEHDAAANASVIECLEFVRRYKLYVPSSMESERGSPPSVDVPIPSHVRLDERTRVQEQMWSTTYDERKEKWKKGQCISRTAQVLQQQPEPSTYQASVQAVREDTNEPGTSSLEARTPLEPRVVIGERRMIHQPLVDETIMKWTLNSEQACAFRIIAEHTLVEGRGEPLRMMINGPGGTGKSRVIQALNDFFGRTQQSRRFRLASFTGMAARNISGMTIHGAVGLGMPGKRRSKSKTLAAHRELIAMWDGVDYLFIDEISMVSCELLLTISTQLQIAKSSEDAFGGVNLIFAGDFAQLPPVGGTRLYADIESRRATGWRSNKKAISGYSLWQSVETVITLTRPMRQSGDNNAEFVELLARLREGKCTDEDHRTLSKRVVRRASDSLQTADWDGCPIIVSGNAVRDALNALAVEEFAHSAGVAWHWYYSMDKIRGQVLHDPVLQEHLNNLHAGQTNYWLTRVPLAVGMKVVISQNFDVASGIVNGSIGTLKQIRYTEEDGKRHLLSCVVYLPDCDAEPLPNLPPKYVPVLRDSVDVVFKHPHTHKAMTINRT